MLFEAFHWDPIQPRPRQDDFVHNPEFRKLIKDWGRPGDSGMMALDGEKPVAAGWFRLWNQDEHSYGFVDGSTPELSIAVRKEYRSQGIGRKLLRSLFDEAIRLGFSDLSLSVDPSNFALLLYESEGFIKHGELETSWTMLRSQ